MRHARTKVSATAKIDPAHFLPFYIQTNSEAPRESSTGSALVSDCFPVRSRRGLADALAKFERERRSEIAVQKADRRARAVGHARNQDISPARNERGQNLFAAGFG